MMNYSIAQMFVLVLCEKKNEKIIKKEEGEVSLSIACFWDMFLEKVVELNDDLTVSVLESLPETLSYCSPVYKELVKKPGKKVSDIIAAYIVSLNKKRRDQIFNDILLSVSQQEKNGVTKQLFADTLEVNCKMAILFELLLENKKTKKMFSDVEQQQMKKAMQKLDSDEFKKFDSFYKVIVDKVISEINALVAAASASAIILS